MRSYLAMVEEAWHAERRFTARTDFSQAVAVGLHRVLAYKDEYEVARLLTAPGFAASIRDEMPSMKRVRFQLHPPLLRALGLRRKISLGPAGRPILTVMARLRFLRGTPFDPFGYARTRRVERALAREYTALVSSLASTLDSENYEYAVAVASAIELVRGYEGIKLANVEHYRARLAELRARGDAVTEAG